MEATTTIAPAAIIILALGYGIPILVVIWTLKTLAQIGRDVAAIRERLAAHQD